MACFLVPTVEAVVVTAVARAKKKSEQQTEIQKIAVEESSQLEVPDSEISVPTSRKLTWLSYLLWGGALLLAFEHVWHGEVVPWFPFLTAAADPSDAAEMLHEMSTIGVTMAVLVTAAWGAVVAVVNGKVSKIKAAAKAAA